MEIPVGMTIADPPQADSVETIRQSWEASCT
jgi:hypothetical protein